MPTVILDRDGVINQDSEDYIKSADEWLPLPGSINAIAKLSQHGFRVVVATNQSGIARGLFDEYALAQMHHKLCSMVEEAGGTIDGIFYCPHSPEAGCDCRKPATGLLRQIESEFACDLAGSFFVGDSIKDLQAAQAWQCKPLLVRTGKGLSTESQLSEHALTQTPVLNDLSAAIDFILENASREVQ